MAPGPTTSRTQTYARPRPHWRRQCRPEAAPPYRGIRFKSLEAPTRRRGIRTLTMFVSQLLEAGGSLEGFVVTLPKITSVEQVESMVALTERIEQSFGITPRSLRFELQIETPQSILGPDGTALVARMIHAADGRCTALHYGTYDYSAFCGIPAAYQSMEHAVADHAKLVMQAAAAGTGVRLSDGSTNVLPVGDEAGVRRGWELHARLVRRSLERGYYQGWDLHPAQLPTRFAATYAFYRSGFDACRRPAPPLCRTDRLGRHGRTGDGAGALGLRDARGRLRSDLDRRGGGRHGAGLRHAGGAGPAAPQPRLSRTLRRGSSNRCPQVVDVDHIHA